MGYLRNGLLKYISPKTLPIFTIFSASFTSNALIVIPSISIFKRLNKFLCTPFTIYIEQLIKKPVYHSLTSSLTHMMPLMFLAFFSITLANWNAIASSLFEQWMKNVQSEKGLLADGSLCLKQVLIQGVDMFGNRVGFLKFKADVIDKETGQKVPGIVFARGPAVSVLILLESDGKTYTVLTEQVRVPVGRPILELPAGMLDDNVGDVVGTAIREVEEETGIQLHLDDMVDLTSFLDPSTGRKVIPSPGGCDEELSLLLYRRRVSEDVIKQLQGKETGLREHGELIKVHVVPYETLWRTTPDAKVLMSIAVYEMAKRDGLLS